MKNPKNFRLPFFLLICVWTFVLIVLASCSPQYGCYYSAASFQDQLEQPNEEVCLTE